MPREYDPQDRHRFDRDRYEDEGPVERVSDTGGENRSWRERRRHFDEHEHDAGGTYAFRDQSDAARRSRMRTDQRYEDTGMAYGRDSGRPEGEYGRRDPGHSGYGSSGQGQYGRGGFAQGGYGQTGIGQDYGQRDPTRSDAASGLHPDHDLEPEYLDWRRNQLSGYDRDYASWREQQSRRHDDEYRKWRDERRSSFHQSFSAWRDNQSGLTTGVNTHAMQPGLSANAAQISQSSGPGPSEGEFNADPTVVGERNAGQASVTPDTVAEDDRREAAGRDDAGTAGGSLGMSPEANPALSNLAGGGAGRTRERDKDESR